MSAKTILRARLAAYERYRAPEDPARRETAQDYAELVLAEEIARIAERWPSLRPAQVDRLVALLRHTNNPPQRGVS